MVGAQWLFVNDPNAWLKDVKPFLIDNPLNYLSKGPHDLTSTQYAKEFNEVKDYGRLDSTQRTAEQTETALFWSEHGFLHWSRTLRAIAADQRLDDRGDADAAPQLRLLHERGAEAVGPLRFLQVRDRRRVLTPVTALRFSRCDRRFLFSEHGDGSKIVPILQVRRVDDERHVHLPPGEGGAANFGERAHASSGASRARVPRQRLPRGPHR